MKQYIVKYLPIVGEIKGIRELFDSKNPNHSEGLKYLDSLEGRKLFLCSRDILIHDTVYNPVTKEYETVIKDLYEGGGKRPDNCTDFQEVEQCGSFKVIGEISPEATWVKEGDEFDEDEVKIIDINESRTHAPYNVDQKLSLIGTILVELKGSCGHFH